MIVFEYRFLTIFYVSIFLCWVLFQVRTDGIFCYLFVLLVCLLAIFQIILLAFALSIRGHDLVHFLAYMSGNIFCRNFFHFLRGWIDYSSIFRWCIYRPGIQYIRWNSVFACVVSCIISVFSWAMYFWNHLLVDFALKRRVGESIFLL